MKILILEQESAIMHQKFDFKNELHIGIIILKNLGLWPAENKFSKKEKYASSLIFLVIFFLIPDFVSNAVNVFFVLEDFDRLSSVLSMLAQRSTLLVQMVFFLQNVNTLKAIIDELEIDIMQPSNKNQEDLILDSLKIFRIFSTYYFWSCTITCGFYFLLPVIMGNRFLPFDSWYPYPYLESPWFELSYIHQCIATSFNHFMHTGIDCLYSGLMAIVGSQCDFLRYKILEYKQPGEFGVPINNIDSLKEDDLDYESFFKNIVKHHKHILGISKKINDLLFYPVFCQISLIILLLCTALFRLTVVQIGGLEFFIIVGFLSSMALQMFLYCWFGTEVDYKSQELHSAIFHSDWLGSSTRFQKNLILFMRKTQEPIRMFALNFVLLSTETFTSIMRSSWSFFSSTSTNERVAEANIIYSFILM